MEYYIKECPHCFDTILLYHHELNCKIYRHGVFKSDLQQMNPHTPKEECDRFVKQNLIYGCGKPFRVYFENDNIVLVKCDYI
jgi:hypothetical protein